MAVSKEMGERIQRERKDLIGMELKREKVSPCDECKDFDNCKVFLWCFRKHEGL